MIKDKWTQNEGLFRVARGEYIGTGLTKGRAMVNLLNNMKINEQKNNKRISKEAHDAKVAAAAELED